MVEVVLRAVRVDVGSATPLLLLEEVGGSRVLPIFIGAPEATAIAYALQGVQAPRPMSHDLLGDVISALGAKLFAVEIVDLIDNTFYANLRLLREELAQMHMDWEQPPYPPAMSMATTPSATMEIEDAPRSASR